MDALHARSAERNRGAAVEGGAVHGHSAWSRPSSWRKSLPERMTKLLRAPAMACLARTLLTLPFWVSGISKLLFFDAGVAEMARAGLEPAVAFNIATIVVQLAGSALIILNRGAWLGAGALASFTALTILLVHRFWAIADEPFRTIALHVSTEHLGLIGGLLCAAVLAVRQEQPDRARHTPPAYGRPEVRR